ncbi:unnamed protein product [Hermetia illucens]|uniref:Uncharacterized protein n=1 Tax=Hermetia illucens TaxID=343691 RepID=A0A7R8UMK5_HERIL|nr:unnamed protein product [Hermetia illucens]
MIYVDAIMDVKKIGQRSNTGSHGHAEIQYREPSMFQKSLRYSKQKPKFECGFKYNITQDKAILQLSRPWSHLHLVEY